MALSVIDVSDSGFIQDVSSATFSHDVSGSNTLIVVPTSVQDTADRDVSTVTYNGDDLTEIRQNDEVSDFCGTSIWRRVAPDAGTHNVVVTWVGDVTWGFAGAITFAGADQTTPIDADTGDDTFNEDPVSTEITTVTDNAYIVDADSVSGQSDNFNTAGSGQTEIYNQELNTARDIGSSYKGPVTPAGATTMEWDQAGSSIGAHTLVAIRPATDEKLPDKIKIVRSNQIPIPQLQL